MLTIYPTLKDQSDTFIERALAMAKESMAINLSWLGEFEQAYRLQQEAQDSYRTLAERDMVVNAEITLADFDYGQGSYGSALQRYYHAQDLLVQHTIVSPKMVAYVKLQIANTLVKLNRAYEARPLAYEAVEIYRQLDVSLDAMDALRDYANVLAASGRHKEALAALDEAEMLFARGGLAHHTLATRLQRAELLLQTQACAEAYQTARTLKALFETQGLVARSVRAGLIMVEALLYQAEKEQETQQRAPLLREAAELGKSAVVQAQRHHLQEEVYRGQFFLGRRFAFQGEERQAHRRYRAAIAQIERMLDDLLYDLSPSFLHTAWTVYADTVALYLQQGQTEQAFHYLERARSMALRQYLNRSHPTPDDGEEGEKSAAGLSASKWQEKHALILRTQDELKTWQERYRNHSVLLAQADLSVSQAIDQETLQAELKRCEAKISELFERLYLQQATKQPVAQSKKGPHPKTRLLDVTQLRQHLTPNQLLLAYFLHKEHLVMFALTTERLVTHDIPDGMQQLTRLLSFLHAHLQPGGWPDPQHPPQQAIRQMLRKLYALLIAPIAELLPSPPGHLLIVPYGPLHTLPFHALYDGAHFLVEDFQVSYLPTSNLLAQTSPASEVAPAPYRSPLVLGYSGRGHLQHTLQEASTLAQMLDARCYLEEEATIARLIEQAPGSPIIHLATHGHSRLDAPNFSAVTLADGRFNALDTFSLDLRGCELVTLSGCETGLAFSSGGDEQVGLGRAFLAVGAKTLVMSLWPVEDSATSELMQLFYQKLLQGASKIQALCDAQRAFIEGTASACPHPYYWAAFRLVGQTDPLRDWNPPQ